MFLNKASRNRPRTASPGGLCLRMAYGWEGERLRLVPLDEAKHFENYVLWLNDPSVTEWLLVGDLPLTRLMEKAWFERAAAGSPTDVYFAIETLDGVHIGTTALHHVDYKHGTAESGSFIGPAEYRGHGYGTEAAKLRARFAFEVLGLRLLMTSYLGGNEASRRMSEKAGYVEVGRVPARYWKRGAYRDGVILALDRERWLRLTASAG